MDTQLLLGRVPDWYPDAVDPSLTRYWDGTKVVAEMHWDGARWVEWWQAVDGKFYAPELHPNALAQDPVQPRDPAVSPSVSTADPDQQPTSRRRTSAWMIVAAAMLVVASAVAGLVYSFGSNPTNALVGDSPSQLAALVSTAVNKAGSVHVVTTIETPDEPTATYVNDVAGDTGQQVITVGGAQLTTLVVGNTAYVKANELALTIVFQQSAAVAQQYADKWMAYNSGGQAYVQIADTLTLGSLLHDVTPASSGAKVSTSTVKGKAVVGIQGALSGAMSGTLYVSSTDPYLPVEEVGNAKGAVSTSVFSGWGEAVNVTAPTGALPGIDPGAPAS